MRERPLRALLGALFIIVGVLLLTGNLGSEAPHRDVVVSGAVSLLGVMALVLFGTSRSWWLLPLGCALVTVGLLQVLYSTGLDNFATLWGVSLVGLGGPLVGLYLNNAGQWGWLIPGYVLWLVGGLLALAGLPLPLDWLATLGLWLVATLFFVLFAGNRRAWWAFTSGYVLWAAGAGLRLAERALSAEMLASWALWALALPFWLGYLRDDARRGRLLVAGALTIAGGLPLLFSRQPGSWLAIGASSGVGLVWLAAWLRRRKQKEAS